MNHNEKYLQYLFHEEIYLVKEDHVSEDKEHEIQENDNKNTLENKTVVIINHPALKDIPAPDQALLSKILRSINLKLEDVLTINPQQFAPERTLPPEERMANVRIIGFFDSVPESWQQFFSTTKYELHETESYTSLHADPLDRIEKDRSIKKILWDKLQKLYNLV
jgi:DNA polymerase III psi subunit